ncbi:unnamed protein product [Protopolystoma xenopodis]|uniref:Uncharacterized protein n=1 Tax=Protopolystoma xenopodis TaxID=117903 RepID=A0A448XJF6_9PLAT|nr:unnamed protein product [Protopolystoma xenopodis]
MYHVHGPTLEMMMHTMDSGQEKNMTYYRDPAATILFAHVIEVILVRHADLFDKDWIQWSEVAEHMVETGHEIEWSQTSRFADYGTSVYNEARKKSTGHVVTATEVLPQNFEELRDCLMNSRQMETYFKPVLELEQIECIRASAIGCAAVCKLSPALVEYSIQMHEQLHLEAIRNYYVPYYRTEEKNIAQREALLLSRYKVTGN